MTELYWFVLCTVGNGLKCTEQGSILNWIFLVIVVFM